MAIGSWSDLFRKWYDAADNAILLKTIDDIATYSGDISAPGADAQILTFLPAAGTYEFEIYLNIAGASAAIDRPNVSFRTGPAAGSNNAATTEKLRCISTLNSTTESFRTRFTVNGAQHLQLRTIAAATAGTVYRASVVAKRAA